MINKQLILGIDIHPETTEEELVKIKAMIFKLLPSRVFAGNYEEAVHLKKIVFRDEKNGDFKGENDIQHLN